MRKLLFLMLVLLAYSGVAQTNVFDKVLFDPAESSVLGCDVQVVPGQGYLIAGSRHDAAMVCLTDTLGNPLWIRKSDRRAGYISAMAIQGDSTIVAAGNSVVACLGLDGNMHWSIELNEEYFDPQSLLLTSDTTFVIAGKFFSDANQKTEAYLMELSVTGAIRWSREFYTTNSRTTFGSVRQAPGGGFLVVGSTDDYLKSGVMSGVFVTRLDEEGHVIRTSLYSQEIGFWADFKGFDLVAHGDHLTVFIGIDNSNYLLQSDTLGNVLQAYSIGWQQFGPFYYPGFSRLVQAADGGFVAINGGQFGQMVKTDPFGMLLWTSELVLDAKTAAATPDGGYIVLGNGPLMYVDNPVLWPHLGLIKTDSIGNSPSCAYAWNQSPSLPVEMTMEAIDLTGNPMQITAGAGPAFVDTTLYFRQGCVDGEGGVAPVASDRRSLIVAPNPASTSFSVVSSGTDLREATRLVIYNNLSEPVVSLEAPFRWQNSVNTSNLAPGFYMVAVTFPGITLSQKLIIRR